MKAMLALEAGDRVAAAQAAERCLALRPDDFEGLRVVETLRGSAPAVTPERVGREPGSPRGP